MLENVKTEDVLRRNELVKLEYEYSVDGHPNDVDNNGFQQVIGIGDIQSVGGKCR